MKFLLFVIAGLLVIIARIVVNFLNKASQGSAIDRVKKNPALATEFAAGLDIPYGQREITPESFVSIVKKLQSAAYIGPYKILHALPSGRDGVLVFTELSFADFDTGIDGHATDVKKTAFHNFLVKFDAGKSELQVNSSIHETSTQKFQKQEFVKHLLAE